MLGLSHRAHANAQQQNCVHARSICARVCVCMSVVPSVLVCVLVSVSMCMLHRVYVHYALYLGVSMCIVPCMSVYLCVGN